jgi:hypothetical protein
MLFPTEAELFFGSGLDDKQVQLTNLDFYKILPKITKKPFKVMRYFELPTKALVDYNIILYQYPGFVGHWTLLCMDKELQKAYFFDPYGRDVDTQWIFLKGYNGTEYYILKNIIDKSGYRYYHNPYNIQGHLKEQCNTSECKMIADNECGELVCFRILYKDLSDLEFYHKCLQVGSKKIFSIIKDIEKTT